jgi:hypothetical protein
MKKLLTISGLATAISLAVGPALAYQENFFPGFGGGFGGRAPAPEIGVGVLGVLLSVAAVKYFRSRSRS